MNLRLFWVVVFSVAVQCVGAEGPLGVGSGSGLVGDGKADDTAALQRLMDTQGAVRLVRGRYRLTRTVRVDLSVNGFSALSGDGTATLVMEGAGPALHFVGSHGGTAAPPTVKPQVWERERAPMVEGIEIVGGHAEADGIEATGVMQLTLSRVVVRECRHAVHFTERNRNVLLSACHFYHNRGIGVFYDQVNLHQSNIVGCHISYNGGGGIVSRGGEVRNLQVGTCDIEANHAEDGPPTANLLLDSRGGSIAEVAVTGCTLQHTRKAPGSANIRILGAGNDASLLRRAGRETTREGHVTIVGNVFSDVQVNIEVREARGVTISANTFWEGFSRDLVVEDSSHVVVTGNNFDRNPRYLVNGAADAENNGVLLVRCEDVGFTGNVVSGVRHQRAAVEVRGASRLQFSHNSILDSDGVGLRLEDVRDSIVTGNIVRDERPAGERSTAPSLEQVGVRDSRVDGNLLGNP